MNDIVTVRSIVSFTQNVLEVFERNDIRLASQPYTFEFL